MAGNLNVAGGLIAIVILGCAPSTRSLVLDVYTGMTIHEVADILGEPTIWSTHENYEAWRYEYKQLPRTVCKSSGTTRSQLPNCAYVCEHATIWFTDEVVSAVTGAWVDNLKWCGACLMPIDWDQMPEYAKSPGD